MSRLAAVSLLLLGGVTVADARPEESSSVRQHSAATLVEWMDLTRDIARAQSLSPPVASRLYAYAGIAAYEAAAPGMPNLGHVHDARVQLVTQQPIACDVSGRTRRFVRR